MHSKIHCFFSCSDLVRHEILRPLSHILPNWELSWSCDDKRYESEDDSFASLLNDTIDELESCVPPAKYHDNENALAEHVQKHLNWGIHRKKISGSVVMESDSRLTIISLLYNREDSTT
jgi:hypothetical protein